MNKIEKRIEELADELSALCEEHHAGCLCLCVKGISTREAFKMGVIQGKQFLADLNASAEYEDEKAYMDMDKIQSSAAFALGLLRAFTGSSIRAEETLVQMYAEDCLGEA